MDRSSDEEIILESLLKLGAIVPIQQVKRAFTTRKMLMAKGEKCSLADAMLRHGELTDEQMERLRNIEELIPGYTIWEKIGEGKLDIVYKARQHSLDRWVLIKILKPQMAYSEPTVGRFLREVQALGQLDHPNILRAMDSGKIGNLYYLISEYFDGITLSQYVKIHHRLSETRTLQTGAMLASALTHIWNRGMIHRDVIPENIMISQDDVKLCDLSLIRAIAGDAVQTPYPVPRRSYSYIPPEQIQGKPLDFRSDIYSLGAVLYFAATGHHVIEDWDCKLEDILGFAIVDPKSHVPQLSDQTRVLIMQLLSFTPENRWSSKDGLSEAFSNLLKERYEEKSLFRKAAFFSLKKLAVLTALLLLCYTVFILVEDNSPQQIFMSCAPGVVVIQCADTLGSGVFMSYKGQTWILTNAHLIRKEAQVYVTLKDGRKFEGKVVRMSDSMDLALLAVPYTLGNLTILSMSDRDVHVGDDVFIIGHPKGYGWSLSRGTVSGLRDDTIQTDAAIAVGNSGGPVLDRHGRIVGIATYAVGKGNPIAFAISNARVLKFLQGEQDD